MSAITHPLIRPLFQAAQCGYCGERLTPGPRGDWRCESCQPRLAAVTTKDDWILAHRRLRAVPPNPPNPHWSGVMSASSVPRVWEIRIPSPGPWLTENDRDHWRAKAALVRMWRNAAFVSARRVKPPKGLDHVRVDVLCRWAKAPVRDLPNIEPTIKACVDGAVGPARRAKSGTALGYGIVVDDNDRHVTRGALTSEVISLPAARTALNPHAGELVLTVTEVTGC